MSYQVLARKWRPRRFADLVGQGHVVRALVNALEHDRLHHAFLFSGTRGVGKTTIARILAKSINCEAGVSSQPCGTCQSCREVDEGRFMDLIEVDAASRTKVDDTRELLDNVQYAPTRGRYKVYLIDEVHMLSGHSFNALLKTLEEPPPHVKFLLATTDPQKLPVTVLSRCLQFNLKRLAPEQIGAQLEKILGAEAVSFDGASLARIARAADGSMRDALSLLDQAISFGDGKLVEDEVRQMLGSVDRDVIVRLLAALIGGNAKELLALAEEIGEHGVDYDAALDELLLALHHIALAQVAPEALDAADDTMALDYAKQLPAEDVQLYYQIGLIGRRDLPLAPDPRTGFEMVLLRMLAFRPAQPARELDPPTRVVSAPPMAAAAKPKPVSAAVSAPQSAPSAPTPPPATATPAANAGPRNADWSALAGQLKLAGLTRELANNMTLDDHADGTMHFILDSAHAHLLSKEREAALRQALETHYGQALTLRIVVGSPAADTPAKEKQRQLDARQQAAIEVIANDPNVRALQEQFNARVNPTSVRPKV